MITNQSTTERRAGKPERKPFTRDHRDERPHPPETVHHEETFETERKRFTISRRENLRGQFLRIVEEPVSQNPERSGHYARSVLIVPLDGAANLIAAISRSIATPPNAQ